MPKINIEGRKVTVGDEFLQMSPEQQQSTVDEIAKSIGAMPDERAIDKDLGAGVSARAAVSIARTPEDKLSTLKKYYPDARPYEGDNFVFTDPETGRPTLFNDQGWLPSVGDVASFAPAAYELGGGIVGGALALPPAIAGVPATAGASLLAVPAGIGLGAAAGRELADITGKYALGVEDTRGLGEKAVDVAVTGGLNTAGAKAGEVIAKGTGQAFGAVKRALGGRTGAQTASDFAATGTPTSAGAITGNRGIQTIEQGLTNTPGGARTMQEAARGQADAIASNVDEITRGLGGARTQEGAGDVLQDAASSAASRFSARQGELYKLADAQIGQRSAELPATRQLYSQLINEQRAAKGARNDVINPVLNRVRKILAPKRGSPQTIDFDALRKVRTDVGRMLKARPMGRSESANAEYLNGLYGALTRDIETAAQQAGPDAIKALKLADRYTRFNLNVNIPLMERLTKLDAPEKAFQFAVNEAQKGGTKLAKLRRNFTPKEWDTVSATVIDRLGAANPSAKGAAELGGDAADFSVASFLTNWNKLSPEAKKSLFGGKRYRSMSKNLDRLVRVADRVKDTQRMANTSGTARSTLAGATIGAAGIQLMGGNVLGALGTIAGTTAAPYLTARMMTSPRFINWLVRTSGPKAINPNNIPSVLGRLTAIAKAEPDIAQEVMKLQAALQSGQAAQYQQ